MALTTFTKVSAMLVITQTTGYPKYYGATAITDAKFNPSNDGLYVYITVGNDSYQIPFGDIKVTNTRAVTLTDALTLLNSILGT